MADNQNLRISKTDKLKSSDLRHIVDMLSDICDDPKATVIDINLEIDYLNPKLFSLSVSYDYTTNYTVSNDTSDNKENDKRDPRKTTLGIAAEV